VSGPPPAFSYRAKKSCTAGHPLALFRRPRGLCFPQGRFIPRLRLPLITLPVALFAAEYFQSLEVVPEGLPHQCGTVLFHSPRCPIRGLQKTFIENNLDRFHMWTLVHSILHTQRLKCSPRLMPGELSDHTQRVSLAMNKPSHNYSTELNRVRRIDGHSAVHRLEMQSRAPLAYVGVDLMTDRSLHRDRETN
jgi:hypothetical protein